MAQGHDLLRSSVRHIDTAVLLLDTPSPFVTIRFLMPLPRPSARARWRLLFLLLIVSSVALVFAWPRQPLVPAPQTAQPAMTSPVASTSPRSEPARTTEPADHAATEHSTPKPLPSVTPHRAPASLRAADLERLARETDLSAFVAELQARADAGDADAAWTLVGIYARCSGALQHAGDPERLSAALRSMQLFGIVEAELPIIERAELQALQRCSGFAGATAAVILAQAAAARALALGHPAARLQASPPRVPFDSPQMREFDRSARAAGIEVLQQGDPLDLARYAVELSQHSPYAYDGYLLAACSLIPACVSNSVGYALEHMQATAFEQSAAIFISIRSLSPRQRQIAQAQSEEILRLWRARQYEQLLRGRAPLTGAGDG